MEENLAGQTADRDPYAPEQLLAAAKTRLAHAEVALVRAEADGRKGGFFNGLGLSLALRERNEAKRALAREEAFQANAVSACPACTHDWSGVSDRQVRETLSGCSVHAGMLLDPVREMEANLRAHAAELRAEQAERRVAILERAASAEFEWEGQVDIGTDLLSPVPVRIRSTEAGIRGVEETIQRLHATIANFDSALYSETERALDLEDRWQDEVTRAAALEQRVRDLEGAVDTYARFARAMRHLDIVGAAA